MESATKRKGMAADFPRENEGNHKARFICFECVSRPLSTRGGAGGDAIDGQGSSTILN